jgi:hypothetical protein
MKKYDPTNYFLSLASACLFLAGCATNQTTSASNPTSMSARSSQDGGHLIIHRVANFGTDLFLTLSVDGAQIADLGEGRTYDGYLPPGRHVLSAVANPNRNALAPFKTTLNIQKGGTYSFTAIWQGSNVVLVKD